MELEAERNRADDGSLPADDEVHRDGTATEDDVVAAEGVDKNVIDVGQGRYEKPCMGLPMGRMCRETQCISLRPGEPNGMDLRGCQSGVSERSTGPTPPRSLGGHAGASGAGHR